MTEQERAFLAENGIHNICYLGFDFASTQSFGEKTCADVDSFSKALQRCKNHDEYVTEVFKPKKDELKVSTVIPYSLLLVNATPFE